MGREKALERVHGQIILDRIVARLGTQSNTIAINANGDTHRFAHWGLPIIVDMDANIGTPIAGLHAALAHAAENDFDAVLTAPSDTPFLPLDLMKRLQAENSLAAIARSGGQAHYLTGLWSVALLPALQEALQHPRTPRLQDWCSMCQAALVEWPTAPFDPFFNVNTPEELAEAEQIAARFEP
jgi:molybdopterin-guanine dinucleotide biosynthesis protein A